ncbi:MAG TPA: hypothetical protein VG326_08400 [Tepidisphaeraceae bacterium]|jgi:hypothetical protein|nr:hypothetical protein [Tepidisphaeraceae bacterium]
MKKNNDPPFDAELQIPGPDDAAFDLVLQTALRARPEPEIPLDLAGKAMRLARTRESAELQRRAERLARQRWWAQMTGIAAAVLIGAILAGAAHRLWTRGDITSIAAAVSSSDSDSATTATSTAAATSSDDTSSSSATTTGSTGIVASVFVGELLLTGMLLASLSRGGVPGPWTSEAVAGLY